VAEARTALPGAKLTTYTNGDYLTANLLDCLNRAGLNEMKVTLYPSGGGEEADQSLEPIKATLARLNLREGTLSRHRERLEVSTNIGAMLVRVALPLVCNFSNRAGSVWSSSPVQQERTERKTPCYLPAKSAAIDWLGNVKLCCQIYDVTLPQYESYFIGNVLSSSFGDLWYSRRMNVLRTTLARAHFGDSLWACRLCDFDTDKGVDSEV
jgi:MoaA/NifB/PqqE/SkfB family radical SAM enzyme